MGSTYQALAAFARKAEQHALDLPAGCYVNYDLAIIDFLKSLDSAGPQKDYEALARRARPAPHAERVLSLGQQRAGHAPTGRALVRAGAHDGRPDRAGVGRGRAVPGAAARGRGHRDDQELQDGAAGGAAGARRPSAARAAGGAGAAVPRRAGSAPRPCWPTCRQRCVASPRQTPPWARYWRDNPVNAWTGGNRPAGTTAPFKLEGSTFALAQSVPAEKAPALAAMLQELVDYRLAAYEVRLAPAPAASNVVPFPARRRDAVELPYFPNLKIACGHFKTGRTDSEEHRTLPRHLRPARPEPALHRARHRQLHGRRQEPGTRRRLSAAGTDQPDARRLDHRHVRGHRAAGRVAATTSTCCGW